MTYLTRDGNGRNKFFILKYLLTTRFSSVHAIYVEPWVYASISNGFVVLSTAVLSLQNTINILFICQEKKIIIHFHAY